MKANEVIKLESLEHGQKVKKYFESLGIDTKTKLFRSIGYYYGLYKHGLYCWSTDEVSVKGLKIIKLPEENTYPRVMIVSDDKDFANTQTRVVHKEVNMRFAAWSHAETLEEAEDVLGSVVWKYAKDIEHETETIVELTLQDISEGKGIGVPAHLIRIKE